MSAKKKCPVCGEVLPEDSPRGNCPGCLFRMAANLASDIKESKKEAPPYDDNHFKAPISVECPTEVSTTFVGEGPDTVIDHYKLLRKIGEGGFGVVYLAEQDQPLHRQVAFKILKPGMDTRQVVARFEAERQALALMEHPNIAKVLDGGATSSSQGSRPYFVMELVDGIPITDYCDRHQLGTEKRLELFMCVCHAIQHAHQKGVIHRDIKPSNVLIVEVDGQPTPKVIDFGIAKATQGPLTEKTLITQQGQFMGTPAYMSPEQAGMDPDGSGDIDTRTDIYSLGILLYELLTGRTPFEYRDLMQRGFGEIWRKIRENEPPKPSTRIGKLDEAEIVHVARCRASQPERLRRRLHGDLDWIVMRALEKDRNRRYETANGLARDIFRHLNHEPVEAKPGYAVGGLSVEGKNRVNGE